MKLFTLLEPYCSPLFLGQWHSRSLPVPQLSIPFDVTCGAVLHRDAAVILSKQLTNLARVAPTIATNRNVTSPTSNGAHKQSRKMIEHWCVALCVPEEIAGED